MAWACSGEENMSEPLHDYDPAAALDSAEAIEVFMTDALETGDSAYVAKAEAVAEQARQRLVIHVSQVTSEGGHPYDPFQL
jgi:DNA-binding phage protein